MKKNIKGFTLIELLVVIAIIGLLSTLAVVSLNNARMKARDARRQSDLKQISTAMELFRSNTENYPIYDATAGSCGTAGVIAEGDGHAAAVAVCTGVPIVDTATPANTYLQQTPADPTNTGTHIYEYKTSDDTTTGAASYCLFATLEISQGANGFFKCINGSCYLDTVGC